MFNTIDEETWDSEFMFKEEAKDNDLYHHSHKGCDMEKRLDNRFTIGSKRAMEYSYCRTHNVFCSKTGWLFNHYGGTNSLDESLYGPTLTTSD